MLIPHPFGNRPLLPARFVERPNRFIGVFCFEDAPTTLHRAHIADPGRLKELLIPGARVWVVDYTDHATRKLAYALPYVESQDGVMVSVFSRLPNYITETLLNTGELPGFDHYTVVRREPRFINPINGSKSCFDFELRTPDNQPCLLEVKGASLVENGICKFPDAPTVRGARQVLDLAAAHHSGAYQGRVLIICQRPDAHTFKPHADRDPAFAAAVTEAQRLGVTTQCATITLTPHGIQLGTTIPVIMPTTVKQR